MIHMKHDSQSTTKRCIFCGGTPLSKEHIWSEWLHDYLPSSSDTQREYEIIRAGHSIKKGKRFVNFVIING